MTKINKHEKQIKNIKLNKNTSAIKQKLNITNKEIKKHTQIIIIK